MQTRIRSLSAALCAAIFAAACSSSTAPQQELPDPKWKARMKGELSTGREEDPEARDRWYWEQRAYPTGTIPVEEHRAAEMRELANRRIMAAAEDGWQSLGPAPLLDITYGLSSAQNSSGRALTLAIHPQNPDTLFLGTAQGGIWKSTDRGTTWRSIAEESLPTLAINIIRFKPNDANVLFAATGEPNGSTSIHGTGLLRSTDGGNSWQMLPSKGDGWDFEYSSVTGLEFDARDPNTMYMTTATIVTASAFFKAPPAQPNTGFFKSTDGGQSWTRLRTATRYVVNSAPSASVGFMDLEYGGASSPDLLYLSEFFGGLLKSEDGGATWNYITPRKPQGYGALPAPVANLDVYDSQTRRYVRAGRFPNTDSMFEYRRVEIGMAKSDPRVLYAGFEVTTNQLDLDNNGVYDPQRDQTMPMGLLFKSVDAGATWQWLGSFLDGVPNYCTSQCTYDNVITVNPNDANDVWIGGSANYSMILPEPHQNPTRLIELPWRGMIYRSTDGGDNFVDTTPHCTSITPAPVGNDPLSGLPVYTCASMDPTRVIHPDIHGIIVAPEGQIYVVNDGGIYRTSTVRPTAPPSAPSAPSGKRRSASMRASASYTWENLNDGLSTLQFYRIASHPTNPNILLGGMQDNSAGYWNGSTWEGWGAGDGTIAIFDPSDPNIVYLGSQFSVHRHDGGGVKDFGGWMWDVFPGSALVPSEQTAFVPVFAIDPSQPNITYGGSNKGIYRSVVRGEASTRLQPGTNTDGTPTSIAVSPVDGRIVWVGTGTGAIYRYVIDPATGTATSKRADTVSPLVPNRAVSRLVAGVDSVDTLYAVFNGYDANTPQQPGKVFVTTDAGATWKNISGGLPDVPATALAVHPHDKNRMWLATDTAVYTTTDGGTTWTSERRNMPVVAVQDIHYNANTGYLVAATHGRGVWRLAVGASAQSAQK
ncbi:MAG TPA: YCF48-related protein [Thermoanaerobaculia bacterium]|jgi:photosystem II stability/assembly factor-like uncharacterized protein